MGKSLIKVASKNTINNYNNPKCHDYQYESCLSNTNTKYKKTSAKALSTCTTSSIDKVFDYFLNIRNKTSFTAAT